MAKKNKHNKIPDSLPVVPLRDTVIFPQMVVPLHVGRERSLRAIDEAMKGEKMVVLVTQKTAGEEEVSGKTLYAVGTLAIIGQLFKMPDGTYRALVHGQSRVKILEYLAEDPYFAAKVELIAEAEEKTLEIEALMRTVVSQFENYVQIGGSIPEEVAASARNIDSPGYLADMVANSPDLTTEQRQQILETVKPADRLRLVNVFLTKQIEILELKTKIQSEVKKEMDKNQKDYFLREQMKAIQRELGEEDPVMAEVNELRAKIEAAKMPEEVAKKADKELERLLRMPSASPETAVIRTYIDWLVELPWSIYTEDQLDLKRAAQILDEDHYGLRKVKDRILEHLAVRQLAKEMRSPILCFVGPPGVGKTSLGRSIARAMGRKFVRMSLGGIHDEAEIRGHRRTYVGALPGRIIQGIRTAGSGNPIYMLDEIDKVGSDFRGDPSSALLEVLDPEQNFSFSDNYLEVPFDLSKVIFITTANILDPVPPALRDRMEVIELPGYSEDEKLQIAIQFLVPKQLGFHGLKPEQLSFSEEALLYLIREYTKEAGVRNLEREIASICRKFARRIAEGSTEPVTIKADDLPDYIGPPRFFFGTAEEEDQVGVATGVAWTEVGGDIISVEVTMMEGKEDFILTGQLGQVMQESARAGLSYTRSRAKELGISPEFFEKHLVHIHVPAGAIPKDGPSAGITMTTALVSALTGRAVRRDVAMTGEITLRGYILPVGGLKEKMLAAHRAGIKTFILPKKNVKDLVDIPEQVKKEMKIIAVERMDEVLSLALRPARATRKKEPKADYGRMSYA